MLQFIHRFRGLAIFWVVLAHAKLMVVWSQPASAWERSIRAVIEGGDIPFVFISGFLFQYGAARFRYGPYLRGRARGVLLPYLVCSLPVLTHAYVFRYGLFEGRQRAFAPEMIPALLHSLVTAQHMFVPYWFIPTIAVLYLLAPLWLAIDRRPRLYALLPPLLVAGSMLHLSMLYLDVLRDALDVLPVYLLGMAVSRHREWVLAALRRSRGVLLASGALLFAADVAFGDGVRIASATAFSTEHGLIDLPYLQKVILSLWAFERLASREEQQQTGALPAERLLARLADRSFGIFLAHMYVLNFLVRPALLRFTGLPAAGWLPIFGLTALYLGITWGLVELAKRICGPLSRDLIGC